MYRGEIVNAIFMPARSTYASERKVNKAAKLGP
jgi:hypothetical protein